MNFIIFFSLAVLFFSISANTLADVKDFREIYIQLGSVSITYAESGSGLSSEDRENEVIPSSGDVSSISANLVATIFTWVDKDIYFSGIAPLVDGNTGSYYSANVGMNFYLNSLSSKVEYFGQGSTLKLSPRLRYFWGVETGIGYLSYLTETAKKTDLLFELGLNAGTVYNFSDKWGGRLQLSLTKGAGVVTSTFGIKLFLGASYYFD